MFFYMDWIHSMGSPKISTRLSTGDIHGPLEKAKTRNSKYQRENKTALKIFETNRDLHLKIAPDKENHLFTYHATLNPENDPIYVEFTGNSQSYQ